MTMRGVQEEVPMREGVPHCLRDITRRYCSLLSARHVSTVLATVVLTECEVRAHTTSLIPVCCVCSSTFMQPDSVMRL